MSSSEEHAQELDQATTRVLEIAEKALLDGETEKTAHGLKFSETDVHIVCPWHGYEYNVRDGRHPGNKNIRLRPFKVEVKDDEVYVVV